MALFIYKNSYQIMFNTLKDSKYNELVTMILHIEYCTTLRLQPLHSHISLAGEVSNWVDLEINQYNLFYSNKFDVTLIGMTRGVLKNLASIESCRVSRSRWGLSTWSTLGLICWPMVIDEGFEDSAIFTMLHISTFYTWWTIKL